MQPFRFQRAPEMLSSDGHPFFFEGKELLNIPELDEG